MSPTIVMQTAEQNLEAVGKELGRTLCPILRGLACMATVSRRVGWELGLVPPGSSLARFLENFYQRESNIMNLGNKRRSGTPRASC